MIPLPTNASELSVRTRGVWMCYRSEDEDRPLPKAVFPGAFNPLHEGHRRIAEVGGETLAAPIHFELSITNVDKQPLDPNEMFQRIEQFPVEETVWITRAPTFVEKARLFPGAVFLSGADTIARIADARYYDDCDALRDEAINEIDRWGCRFLVLGRQFGGSFRVLSDIGLPPTLSRLCTEVSEERFRVDVSSTELRRGRREGVG